MMMTLVISEEQHLRIYNFYTDFFVEKLEFDPDRVKVDSVFHPAEVNKIMTHIAGGNMLTL